MKTQKSGHRWGRVVQLMWVVALSGVAGVDAQPAVQGAPNGLADTILLKASGVAPSRRPVGSSALETGRVPTSAGACDPDEDLTAPKVQANREQQTSRICVQDAHGHTQPVTLRFDMKRTALSVITRGKSTLLERHPANFSPTLVGAEGDNRFLPLNLQPYRSEGVWLYLSAMRTSGGDGGGMCGAGEEVFLNVLSVRGPAPHRFARHLIASCEQGIAVRTDKSLVAFDAFSVDEQGRLSIRFMAHGEACPSEADKIGWISEGFLQFHTRCDDAGGL